MLRTLLVIVLAAAVTVLATAGPLPQNGGGQAASAAKPPLSAAELDQVVAPIALYPDALVSQILMASTYPLEVVEADRWVKANPNLSNDALAKALNEQTWDASVKSLTGFAQVLDMMSQKLDWTTKLGDAFISQQKDVLAAVQRLRAQAKAAGNLESTQQQSVTVEGSGSSQTIVIQSASPDVIYVPAYDPVVVYGTWPYPAYPPVCYYPPGYVAGTAALAFGVGFACGAAWGWAWGNCNWRGGDVDININRNTNFNTSINRTSIQNNMQSRGLGNGQGAWQHDSEHRRGVSYRDSATAQRYGRGVDQAAAQARNDYRGRAESGRQDLARGAADDFRGGGSGRAGDRDAGRRDPSGGSDRSAFGGARQSGDATRAASNRGNSSRSASGGGGGRSGGASRGGGGGRGGRR
ncbi:MAG TPA: DUF3300 domain-containing protein [Phycisphaerales bacterium]|nr:DUF3300 domain-containing protein [Phycisphaerales bacterium]HMP38407.1 DUF3300 domain-containing protein [Phycisphaerales bacterium]